MGKHCQGDTDMIIPPRYAYSAIAAVAIGAVVILAFTLPPLPQPRQQTVEEIEQEAARGFAEAARIRAETTRIEAQTNALKQQMTAPPSVEAEHFREGLDQLLRGGPSDEL